MTNSSFLYVKILWRRYTETEMAFGERRSPAAVLHTVLHALRAHGFLARRECERAGFSPHAPTFCCTRLKSAKNLYLRHRFFCKIRQIHRFFCIFRQKLQILCRNQAREKQANRSDMARKSGKSLRLDVLFRLQQMRPSLMHFSGCS